jgi:hypothetical protein
MDHGHVVDAAPADGPSAAGGTGGGRNATRSPPVKIEFADPMKIDVRYPRFNLGCDTPSEIIGKGHWGSFVKHL